MRWLTLLLIVLNLALFGYYWQRQQVEVEQQRQQVRLPPVPAWRLLNELADSSTPAPASAASLTQAAPLAASASTAPADDLLSRAAAVPATAGATVVQPEEEADEVVVATPEVPAAVPAVPSSSCYRLGVFSSFDQAQAVTALWQASGSRIDEQRTALDPDYWVYIENPGSGSARRALRQQLLDMGLDNYWVQRGELGGHLSLGLYRNKDSADALLHMLEGRGYPAKIYIKPRYQTRYVVELETQLSAREVEQALADTARRWGSVKSEKKPCQGLASTQLPE